MMTREQQEIIAGMSGPELAMLSRAVALPAGAQSRLRAYVASERDLILAEERCPHVLRDERQTMEQE